MKGIMVATLLKLEKTDTPAIGVSIKAAPVAMTMTASSRDHGAISVLLALRNG